ncbi:hypothetical protein, partial [Cryptosporidium hominis TU502]|uniref:hypothetical protein n=1 Tax=Cryptosporidium hominis (strain TU502) TaxID=353151 RepID=UPI0000452824
MSVCINGKCGNPKNLWSSCHSNRTRHLGEDEEVNVNTGNNNEIQIEWIDLNNEPKDNKDSKGNIYYNVDGFVDNTITNSTELSNQESKSHEVSNNNMCVEDHICA